MNCTKCGDDGICRDGVEEKSISCQEHELSCMYSLFVEEAARIPVKNCFPGFTSNTSGVVGHEKFQGCIKITSDMPGGVRKMFIKFNTDVQHSNTVLHLLNVC